MHVQLDAVLLYRSRGVRYATQSTQPQTELNAFIPGDVDLLVQVCFIGVRA